MSHGWNATCYQIVNPIFEYHFQARTDSVVAFVRARGRRVVAGAPVCPAELLLEVLAEFEANEQVPVLYFGAGLAPTSLGSTLPTTEDFDNPLGISPTGF